MSDLKSGKIKLIKDALKRIASQFDIPAIQYNDDFDVEVVYSTGTILESASKNILKADDLAKIMPVLSRAVNGAIGIESHDNRYYFDADTIAMHELLGGFVEGDYFTPVLFGVRQSKTAGNRLYVVVCSEKIKKTDIVKEPPGINPARTSSPSVTFNLPDIAPFVNDENLIEYFPDGLLNAQQRAKKYTAVAEMVRYTNDKNDRKYREYIQKGRIDAANQMVSAAAKAAGYTIRAYHGTNNQEEKSTWNPETKTFDTEYKAFTVFKKKYAEQAGHFFASDKDNAGGYGSTVYSVYLMMKNPLEIDCKGSTYGSIEYDGMDMDTYEWAEYAKQHHYDGVIFRNIRDGVNYGDLSTPLDEYVVFDSNRIKSAEPITYDDDGKIIPISERFKPTRRDIRYSVSDSVSDRSLLLEAAEREGAGASEELRRFANRVKDLEGLQRRLERQEKKLEELTTPHQSASQTASTRRARSPQGEANEGERAELEGRIAETRELIAKTEERIDRLEKGAKLQREAECNCLLHAPPLNLGASEGAPCRATLISFGTEETIN